MRALAVLLVISACADETVSGYADPGRIYTLTEIDGGPFDARASIRFAEEGRANGDAPCNAWSATQSAPYPWFELGPVLATKRACAELDDEQAFFAALAEMTLAEVQGEVLILSNDAGGEMVFNAQD